LSLRGKYTWKLVLGTSEPPETHLTTQQQLELNICLLVAYTGLVKALEVQKSSESNSQWIRSELLKGVDLDPIKSTKKLPVTNYRFNGPGINYESGTTSSTPLPLAYVIIQVKVKMSNCLEKIRVVFPDDSNRQPVNSIREVNGKLADINNARFEGDFVWPVPS